MPINYIPSVMFTFGHISHTGAQPVASRLGPTRDELDVMMECDCTRSGVFLATAATVAPPTSGPGAGETAGPSEQTWLLGGAATEVGVATSCLSL